MPLYFGGSGVQPSLKTGTNRISLAAGQTWLIQPAGWYYIKPGPYTVIQQYDPILQSWVFCGGGGTSGAEEYFFSDGVNYRLANMTGQAVGATVTTTGTGYTSLPTITIASGNSIWRPVLGAYVTSVTVSNGGSNYTYAPTVIFSAPPAGGVCATGYVTLSAGAVSTITLLNKGGGYTSPPTVSIVNDPREGINGVTAGSGAAAVAVLSATGGVTAVICTDPGNTGYTATTTFTTSGGGGSGLVVTPIFCLAITSLNAVGAGGPYGSTASVEISAIDNPSATVSAPLNPAVSYGVVRVRKASIICPMTTGSVLTTTGAVVLDGGIYSQFSPWAQVLATPAIIATAATVTFNMGGVTDTSYISS